ncbi:hypothetical protein IV54_GL001967 [Levilactobacillus paucivorans]|uniref:Surface layer protein A domain-containing protein n=2 Tax=Levilactobacillus paucivorans TaxID=616990 RepID=A0A0R2LVG4_9LACO|nr:hypothetical protein IV54_GL001967 [Levilactobacillus paucivorans]
MKKMNRILVATMMAFTMLGGTIVPSVTASAAKKTGYSRIEKWTSGFNHDKYRVKNKKGRTYKMTGKAKNIKLKTNHYLKNYKKTKWVRTGITQIKHKGDWMVYYYMKPITKKKHAGGWVKLTDMKPVKTYKADKYHTADFDTWYRTLNKSQRKNYVGWVQQGGASDGDGEPSQIDKSYLN